MTRVRKHHEFVQGPVWDILGADAYLLHDAALSYVNAHLTDGLLPKTKARVLHSAVKNPARQITGLVREGVWTDEGDAYRVCEVRDDQRLAGGRGDEQPSRAYVEGEALRAKERKERWKNAGKNAVPNASKNAVRNTPSGQGSAGQGSTGPEGSSPVLPRLVIVDVDCEHGFDVHSCCLCPQSVTA